MTHGVPSKCGVIGLDIEFEFIDETIGLEEIQAGCRIRVVLVGGGFAGLRLDPELALEAYGLLPLDGHVEECCQMIHLTLHVGVPERGVSLAATPEDISASTQLLGDADGFLYLSSPVGKDIKARRRGRTLVEPRMGEETGGTPEELLTSALLLLLQGSCDGVEGLVGFCKG